MIKSQGWNWQNIDAAQKDFWTTPSIESHYLIARWTDQKKNTFLDLGCGLGRHSIQFAKKGFKVYCFDIEKEAIENTKRYAESEDLKLDYRIGDMHALPYEDESMDAILCRNVISHTDTEGIKAIIIELYRVLKKEGECYLTLCSKESAPFKRTDWPLVDENTRVRLEEGPEYGIPHFYADYDLIKELFQDFKIEFIYHIEDFYEKDGKTHSAYHYHILIKK